MEYTGQDRPEAGATTAFPMFADDIQYADSGFLPADPMPADERRPHREGRIANGDRVSGRGEAAPAGRLMELSHFAEAGRLAGGCRPDSGRFAGAGQFAGPAPLTEISPFPDSSRLAGTGDPADGDPADGDGGFARGGWYTDGDTGTRPVADPYAGYERYAGEQARQSEETDEDRFLTRVYATPANPRQVPPDDDPRPPHLADQPRTGGAEAGHGPGRPPWAAGPLGQGPADGYPGGLPLADYPDSSSLVARLAGLRLDRWLIAIGSLAAAVAVIIAFVTAGGDAATPSSRMAQTGTTGACVSPAPGH